MNPVSNEKDNSSVLNACQHLTDLTGLGCESPFDYHRAQAEIADAIEKIIRAIGEDPGREGLLKTPERFTRAFLTLTQGYHMNATAVVNDAIFRHDPINENVSIGSHDLVLVRDICIASLCEHHLLPFEGKLHIGYVSGGEVLGLSKLARIAEVYSYRLQIQERLTQQIADAVQKELGCHGVMVVAKCSHTCMSMRGSQQRGAMTVTQSMTGIFQEDPGAVQRFHALLSM